jgi:hypothetical protein
LVAISLFFAYIDSILGNRQCELFLFPDLKRKYINTYSDKKINIFY